MRRRRVIRALAVGSVGALAGCLELTTEDSRSGGDGSAIDASTSDGDATTTEEREVLGSGDGPWLGNVVDVRGDPTDPLRSYFDAPVPAVLVGERVKTVYVSESGHLDAFDRIESDGGDVVAVSSVDRDRIPVCEIGSRLRLPGDLAGDAVRSAFPEAIDVASTKVVSGESYWRVVARIDSPEEVDARLADLDVDPENATVYVYHTCDTGDA